MKQVSHIERIRAVAQFNKGKVLNLLGWDDLKYARFQEMRGRKYLTTVICPDGYGVNDLCRSRFFWRWWINQWNRRDDDFLNSDLYMLDRMVYGDLQTYRIIHSPEFLKNQYPHRVVFDASYSVMISEFLDDK
jgi:hypothetical protein